MIRLILAMGIAGALWPVNEDNAALSMPIKRPELEVSSADIFSAAYSIYEDVGSFCKRNEETCLTGQEMFVSISSSVQSSLNQTPNTRPETQIAATATE